jgi:hypothetical protein
MTLHTRFLLVAGGLTLALAAGAQTQGTCTFTVTTTRDTGAEFDPKHVLAIWVTNSSGTFVKTLKKMAASRESHLNTWVATSGKNVVDAVTGATLTAHTTHTVTWNCRNVSGAIVPDGEYRMRVEFTSENAQGPITPATYIKFTKGPAAFNATYPNVTNFTSMSLTYTPDLETFTVVAKGSTWKYSDAGKNLHATAWKTLAYDDSDASTWKSGKAKLGYSDSPATTISYGPDAANVYPCYYFRHKFTSDNVPLSLKLSLLRDDGAIVYLNGAEVVRSNMPAGAVAYATLASASIGGSDETTYFSFADVDPTLVVVGENLLAVEVHQQSVSSSDLGFDLELMSQPGAAVDITFTRGDPNADGAVNLGDAVAVLGYLFAAASPFACASSADANDDGKLDMSDAVKILLHLFAAGGPLPEPFTTCGKDATADGLGCAAFAPCP